MDSAQGLTYVVALTIDFVVRSHQAEHGALLEVAADLVVHAGRVPEIDDLATDAAAIARSDKRCVAVNDCLQRCNQPGPRSRYGGRHRGSTSMRGTSQVYQRSTTARTRNPWRSCVTNPA